MEILGIPVDILLLVLARISGIFTGTPLFGSPSLPVMAKVGLALGISLLLTPFIPEGNLALDTHAALLLGVVGEWAVGALIGFVITLFFAIFRTAGQFLDVPLGFGMVNVLDPQTGTQVPLMGQFQFVLASLLFLGIGGHHLVIAVLAQSYHWVPMGGMAIGGDLIWFLTELLGYVFVTAFQISLPVVGTVFLVDVALGIITRAVPQINVFVLGFPVKVGLGLLLVALALPFFTYWVGRLMGERGELFHLLGRLMGLLGG